MYVKCMHLLYVLHVLHVSCAVCLLRGVKLMMCQDWMWAVLDIFIVASSLWEVAVDIIQAVYEHLRVKMCERKDWSSNNLDSRIDFGSVCLLCLEKFRSFWPNSFLCFFFPCICEARKRPRWHDGLHDTWHVLYNYNYNVSSWKTDFKFPRPFSTSICPRNMKTFRIIRLTRLLKTIQFVKIFRFVMALRMLVTSIMSTLKVPNCTSLHRSGWQWHAMSCHVLPQLTKSNESRS